jgi:hypothetical protein
MTEKRQTSQGYIIRILQHFATKLWNITNFVMLFQAVVKWVVTENIHTPPTEEISAVRRGRGEKIVSDNSKCIRTSEGGRGVNFQFPPWGWCGCFME